MAGTSKKIKYIPIHEMCQHLLPVEKANIMAFYAITGCDVTSHLAGISKVKKLVHFQETCSIVVITARCPLNTQCIRVRRVVCCETIQHLWRQDLRWSRFEKVSLRRLPPTSDAVMFHILRAHYQSAIWETVNLGLGVILYCSNTDNVATHIKGLFWFCYLWVQEKCMQQQQMQMLESFASLY